MDLMTKSLVLNMLNQADPNERVQFSYDNYHTEGVVYLNLLRTDILTIKIYILDPDRIKALAGGWLVNPHDHRYNFGTTVLFGSVDNLVFNERLNDEGAWYRFRYQADTKEFTPSGRANLGITSLNNYWAGQTYYTDTTEIHTLRLTREVTGLLLYQYKDTELNGTRFYGDTEETPDSCKASSLYKPLTVDEYNYWTGFVKARLQ